MDVWNSSQPFTLAQVIGDKDSFPRRRLVSGKSEKEKVVLWLGKGLAETAFCYSMQRSIRVLEVTDRRPVEP